MYTLSHLIIGTKSCVPQLFPVYGWGNWLREVRSAVPACILALHPKAGVSGLTPGFGRACEGAGPKATREGSGAWVLLALWGPAIWR